MVSGSSPSHTQVSDLIRAKEKYAKLDQKDGNFVGFTLSKGECAGVWKNRYSMTSRSSNSPTFASEKDPPEHSLYPSKEWADEIMRACDNLLQLEGDIRSIGIDMNGFCEKILAYKARENDFWKSIKQKYWPCMDKSVEFACVEVDDEW